MILDIMIMNTKTGKPEKKAINAIAVFPFSFPSGHVELFAITEAQGVAESPYVISHVATGYKCGDWLTVATTQAAKQQLTRLLDRVKESGFLSAMQRLPRINTVDDADLL